MAIVRQSERAGGSESGSIYLRSTVEEPEEHEEGVVLAEGGGDDAEGIHNGDDDQNLLTADRVGGAAPTVGPRHHADEDDGVEPPLGLRVQTKVALGRRQDEGHRDDVHLLRRADEATYSQENVVKAAVSS